MNKTANIKKYRQNYYIERKEAFKSYYLKRKYNLSKEAVGVLFDSQNGKCRICEKPLPIKYAIDHDHNTGRVRGLLCYPCNTGIGCFYDNTKFLQKAIEYLN